MKVRKLEFDGNDSSLDKASLLYQGFMTGGGFISDPRQNSIETRRREVRILDKFEKVFEFAESSVGSTREYVAIAFRTRSNHPTIVLDQPEYELLKRNFESTPWQTRLSRQIVDISDWLSSIPLTEEENVE